MKVSIVTAVYNRASMLGMALDSVQQQTHANIEHVLVDGASTDGSVDLIDSRVRPQDVFKSEPDKGIYDALNKGIALATGEVVGLLHSDDCFADTRVVEDIVRAFEDPAVDGVYGDLDYVAKEDTSKVIRRWRSGEYNKRRLANGWMPPHPTLFLRKSVFEKWGAYDTQYQIAADYDAMVRYLSKAEINLAYLPRVLVKMRVGGESNRSIERVVKKSREDLKIIREHEIGGIATLFRKNLSKIGQFLPGDDSPAENRAPN